MYGILQSSKNPERTEGTFTHAFCASAAHGAREQHGRLVRVLLLQELSCARLERDTGSISHAAFAWITQGEIYFRVLSHGSMDLGKTEDTLGYRKKHVRLKQ